MYFCKYEQRIAWICMWIESGVVKVGNNYTELLIYYVFDMPGCNNQIVIMLHTLNA